MFWNKKKLYIVLDKTGKTIYAITESKKIAMDVMNDYSNPYTKVYCIVVNGKIVRG